MKLSVIILSYNTRDLTLAAVDSAWREIQANPSLRQKAEIILVDNASTDDTVRAARQAFRGITGIRIEVLEKNQGFAVGNNHGIRLSQGEYILLLNPDTLVQAGALATLVEHFDEHPVDDQTAALAGAEHHLDRLGILAATLANPDGSWQPQGGSFPSLISLVGQWWLLDDLPVLGRFFPSTQHTGRRAVATGDHSHLVKMGWVAGTAMMVRRQVFDEIGLLDEQIFMYGEDVEFCLRAAHHHWDVATDPQAHVMHYGSASAGSERALKGEAQTYVYLWAKHFPVWQMKVARWIIKLGCLLRWGLFGTMEKYRARARVYHQLWIEL